MPEPGGVETVTAVTPGDNSAIRRGAAPTFLPVHRGARGLAKLQSSQQQAWLGLWKKQRQECPHGMWSREEKLCRHSSELPEVFGSGKWARAGPDSAVVGGNGAGETIWFLLHISPVETLGLTPGWNGLGKPGDRRAPKPVLRY